MSFGRVAIIGLGLLGGSIGLAVREYLPDATTTGYDRDPATRRRAAERGLVGTVHETAADAVRDAELVIFCVPPGAMGPAAAEIADALPNHTVIPAHPVAGTENSGPDAGFAELFQNRWCIVTPPEPTNLLLLTRLVEFWEALGANVEMMDAQHHDLVLAVTSHLPHLIAYTIVGTASDLEDVTQSEVIKYSAGGFRDFTRIAASDPTMWRDVFLSNKDAVLEMLQRFTEDLTALQKAIRVGDGDRLFDHFTHTRAVRRSIIAEGQDDARPDFGRSDHGHS
jgi:cyclohexadieny/prephenate dehydrogenase